jgi:hypothetical protein
MTKPAPYPFDKEPAEGLREVIEQELKRHEHASDRDSKKHRERKSRVAQEEKRDR